jgi:hypothetical protein
MLNRCIVGEIINSQNKNLKSKMASNPKGGKKNFLIEFTNVTNEERNNIARFINDPSNPNLANTSKNFHCVVILLFYHRDKNGDYIQNMRVRFKLCFFEKYILHLLIFSPFF